VLLFAVVAVAVENAEKGQRATTTTPHICVRAYSCMHSLMHARGLKKLSLVIRGTCLIGLLVARVEVLLLLIGVHIVIRHTTIQPSPSLIFLAFHFHFHLHHFFDCFYLFSNSGSGQ
jgi:hypothetical protein